jgi:ComF family protein
MRGMPVCSRCGVPFDIAESPDTGVYTDYGQPNVVSLYSSYRHICGRCLLGRFYFDKARSVALYDGLLRDMLHRFKYEGRLNLGEALSRILVDNLPNDLDGFDLVLPVPLHIEKLRKREYNQSVILGIGLATRLRIPLDPFTLRKIRETRPQFEIENEDERRRNVKGAFSVVDGRKIKKKSILLIDDVFTTGSTVNECARVLFESGAFRVQVLTLMRVVQN